MRLALRVVADGYRGDVRVDVDGDATVGELAARLSAPLAAADEPRPADPERIGLSVEIDGRRSVLAPDIALAESGLRSGSTVSPTTARLVDPVRREVATVRVLAGPDAPASFALTAGTSSIGRAVGADVRLGDPSVSKRHARLRVGDVVEIVDDSSANGIVIGEQAVDRAFVRATDRVRLGDTLLAIELHAGAADATANVVAFNRPPRVAPRYHGVELVAPEPPQPPSGQRFPIVSLLAPVVMAAMIYAITRSTLSILFVALSPVMMVGSWLETRLANRKQLAHETAVFRSALADLAVQLEYAHDLERRGRRAEHPSTVEVIEAIDGHSSLLWTRRPEHEPFGHVRFGLGTRSSRNRVELPGTNRTLPHLWRELLATVDRFRQVDGVPIVAELESAGSLGVAGPDRAAGPVLRSLLVQLAGLHSPAELSIHAVGDPDDWDWMKWLPHVPEGALASNAVEVAAVVARIESMIDERLGDEETRLPVVVLVVHERFADERPRLVQIAERGPGVGVHVVWYAPTVVRLPAACRAFVEIEAAGGRGRVGLVVSAESVVDVVVEPVGAAAVDRCARQLAPLVDGGVPVDGETDLPRAVALVDLVGHDVATTSGAILDRWSQNRSLPGDASGDGPRGLRALVGQAVDGPIHLDLRTQGPHALVGGTTGSGKSEFLQSWILAMAIDHSPARVNFLLVDYKGGAAFADCVDLPHCVGLVTDLSPHLVRRALTSLDAEVRRREQLLHDHRAKDLAELERRGDPACPPSLVIVVDEFAALVADVPEFVDGVVNVAQRGRSLGLHLVLATQRPAGVIRDNLRANTNLRIALRMADTDDAVDVIGTDQAALFDPGVPGRAIVKSGPGRIVPFQTAYIGGHSTGHGRPATIAIADLRFGSASRWAPAAGDVRLGEPDGPGGPTDLRRIVGSIGGARRGAGLDAPPRPWLPELAERYRLEALPTGRTDRALVFGVVDRPELQAQPEVAFHPDRDGNMAVFGTGGAGKSGVLRAIAVAAGFAPARGGPCHVHAIDFGARGLELLAPLPHVGSVVAGDDHERLQRLLRLLRTTIDERAVRYARARAATIDAYRERTGDVDEPRILLLVDHVGAFRAEYEGGAAARWWETFLSIASDGRGVGVHVVVSADRPATIPSGLASSIQRQLVLRLANDMDYALVDAPADALDATSPPGRGFVDGREVQVAVIGGDPSVAAQAVAVDRLAAAMRRAGVDPAPPIRSLPDRISLSELDVGGRPVLGMCDETLGPVGFEPDGSFLVAGPPGSGTSTTVATMVRSLAGGDVEFVLLGRRRSPLSGVARWAATAHGEPEIAELADRLAGRLDGIAPGRLVVVIEAIGQLLNTTADGPLQALVAACRDAGAFVIAEGETSTLTGSWPLLQAVKASRTGLALQPDQMDGDVLFKTPFPRIQRVEFPAGRGLMVHGGRVRKVQVALPE